MTEHEHAHLVMIHLEMMTRNMLNSPSSIDDVRLCNAFSSKESPMTLRILNIDQALACVLKNCVFFLEVIASNVMSTTVSDCYSYLYSWWRGVITTGRCLQCQ